MKKRSKAIKNTLLVSVFILLFGVLSVLGYYAYHGYEMYSSAIEEKSVSEMAANIKNAVGSLNMTICPNFM